jgi:ADP-ribose pyrophosphatase YjhB (NUDIX family)
LPAAGISCKKTRARSSHESSATGWRASSFERIDVFALLDEVRAIAQTGLHYATDPFDRERYEKLFEIATREYADRTGVGRSEVKERFARDVGYVTAKVGVDAALFDEHDRVLLVRRADDDKWGLIAGWVDGHEVPEEAILREIAEEVGLTALVDGLVGVFSRPANLHGNPHSVVSIVYLCHAVSGTLRPQLHEVREIAWRSIDDVGVDDWHHHHERLARAALEAHWQRQAGL